MKIKKHFLIQLYSCLTGIIIISSIVSAAEPIQWFPTENTIIEYNLKNNITLKSGTKALSTTFDVYNFSSSTVLIIPSYWKTIDDGIYYTYEGKSIINNTDIVLKRSYTEESITHLSRQSKIFANGTELKVSILYLATSISEAEWSAIIFSVGSTPISIEKNTFSYTNQGFPDYIDITKGSGYEYGSYSYAAETDTNIFLYNHLGAYDRNKTLIANERGEIITFTHNIEINAIYSEVIGTSFTFYRNVSNNEIPGISTPLIIGLLFTSSIILIKHSKAKLFKKKEINYKYV